MPGPSSLAPLPRVCRGPAICVPRSPHASYVCALSPGQNRFSWATRGIPARGSVPGTAAYTCCKGRSDEGRGALFKGYSHHRPQRGGLHFRGSVIKWAYCHRRHLSSARGRRDLETDSQSASPLGGSFKKPPTGMAEITAVSHSDSVRVSRFPAEVSLSRSLSWLASDGVWVFIRNRVSGLRAFLHNVGYGRWVKIYVPAFLHRSYFAVTFLQHPYSIH
ncbi:hypothetical protein HPB51_002923 [Rhipicephalus microplus]|uniref:Uncharacterized protein n=1 Tax=Rhipicephalus microplus TaxID=6941 RepID=A0A9J6DSD6_RHIMP|nr:hypothetical protein HPB51_002923 [Rhipicephalus microplus]